MLNFADLSIRRGTRLLFEKATFNLYRGEKIGITGENGSGKSTLLALVRGEVTPETGSFDMPGNLTVAHVAQEVSATDEPAIEFVLNGDPELRTTIERFRADEIRRVAFLSQRAIVAMPVQAAVALVREVIRHA
jgi:ATP-binding cassette subfamily F protein 3